MVEEETDYEPEAIENMLEQYDNYHIEMPYQI